MNKNDQMTLMVCDAIVKILELCYQQGVTTTWRDIYKFLRIPEHVWDDESDMDEKIIINQESDLIIIRAMITSKFSTKH